MPSSYTRVVTSASTFSLSLTLSPNRADAEMCLKTLLTVAVRGAAGDELEDIKPNMVNTRRRSNSSTHNMEEFKTKFETVEIEPVFEEELHGPMGGKCW
jgi:hypothetical protein